MSESLTHSDLIYLFIDGEASVSERSNLYQALANNPDLQREFEDAMRMKAAVEREVAAAIPPPSLTEALFLRAGVTIPVAATTAVAPAIPAITNLASSGWFALAKTFAIPVIAVSSIATYGVVKLTEDNTPVIPQPPAIIRTIEAPSSPKELFKMKAPDDIMIPQADLRTKASVNNKTNKTYEAYSSHESYVSDETQNNASTEVNNNSQVVVPVEESEPAFASISTATISELSTSELSNIRGEGDRITLNPLEVRDIVHKKSDRPWSVGIERYIGSSYLQERSGNVPATSSILNNTGVVGMYEVSEDLSLGVMVAEESFPFYLARSDGSFSAEPSITVFAIGARYDFTTESLGGIQPYARIMIGGSEAGAVAKVKGALGYAIMEGTALSAGIELTGVRYQARTGADVAEKTAFTLGLSHSF